jgi:lactoylglutathione lyase
MKRILFIGVLILGFQTGFSQQNTLQTDGNKIMKKQSILGLRTTIYNVGDINKAKAWYAAAFETEPYFDEAFYVGFNIGGYELGLTPEENPTIDKAESVLSYWGVNEIENVYNHFLVSGATEHEKPHSVGEPLMVASVKDPWGNIIGLIYNPTFKLKKD